MVLVGIVGEEAGVTVKLTERGVAVLSAVDVEVGNAMVAVGGGVAVGTGVAKVQATNPSANPENWRIRELWVIKFSNSLILI
jgi:hypothetical protein